MSSLNIKCYIFNSYIKDKYSIGFHSTPMAMNTMTLEHESCLQWGLSCVNVTET